MITIWPWLSSSIVAWFSSCQYFLWLKLVKSSSFRFQSILHNAVEAANSDYINTWPALSRSENMEGHLKLCPKYPLKKLLVASSITHSHLWTFFKIQTANKEQEWRVALVMKDFCSKLFNLIHRNSIESLFYWKLVYNLTVERCRYSLRRREVNPFCLLNYWINENLSLLREI